MVFSENKPTHAKELQIIVWQASSWVGRQTEKHANSKTQAEGGTHAQATDRCRDRCADKHRDRQTGGWTDGRTDSQSYTRLSASKPTKNQQRLIRVDRPQRQTEQTCNRQGNVNKQPTFALERAFFALSY